MRQMEPRHEEKDTKKQQKLLKEAKLKDKFEEPMDNFTAQRRTKNKIESEDSTTFNGLEYFQQQKEVQPQKESITKILSKNSLRERFENLDRITSVETMMMYDKYQKLCFLFREIDEMLFFLKTKQKPTFLTNVSDHLYDNKKIRVTLSQISQILTVYPDAYEVSWSKNEKLLRLDKNDLYISVGLKSHLQIDERQKNFQNHLFNYIKQNGEHIPDAELPKLPNFVQIQDRKAEIIKQIENTGQKSQLQSKVSSEPTLSKLSQSLIEKIRMKKKQEIVVTEHKAPTKQLIQVASMLHAYYIDRNVSNMFYANVIKYSIESLRQFMIDEKQFKEYMKTILEVCPNWIKLIDNPRGEILRMDKSVDLPLIVKNLESLQ